MPVYCPKCGSRFLRESRVRYGERKPWLTSMLRCEDCKTRFLARLFILSDYKWARCPRCERMDLNSWTGKTYDPPFWMGVKINLGAKRWRCEYCRLNFASFRPRKEIFTFNRWQKIQLGMSLSEPSKPPRREEDPLDRLRPPTGT